MTFSSLESALIGHSKKMTVAARSTVRLFVWVVRGLAMSTVLAPKSAETERTVRLFRNLVHAFAQSRAHALDQ
jgi:hypothetical protein